MADNKTKQERWDRLIEAWEESGISLREFFKQAGCNKNIFHPGKNNNLVKANGKDGYTEIVVGNGYTIRVWENFSTTLLVQLIIILENL